MPSLFLIKTGDEGPEDPEEFNVYVLPPIKYPDGYHYLKLGHGICQHVNEFHSSEEIRNWFHGKGDKTMISKLFKIFTRHFPDVSYDGLDSNNCIYTLTESTRPFIDMVTGDIGVAVGGNGCSAKSCDEIGRIAAMMIASGKWTYSDLSAETFRCKYKQANSRI